MTRRLFSVLGLTLLVLAACRDTVGPRWVDAVFLNPDSVFVVPGETGEFRSVPVDQYQEPLPDRAARTRWSIANPTVAGLEELGEVARVTGIQPGETFVRVELGRGTGTGRVYVEPQELAEIRIEPSPIDLPRGSRVTVRPVLIGLDGEEVSSQGYRISWRTSNWRIAMMVGSQEVVTSVSISVFARQQGQATLTLQVGDRKVTTPVTVR